MTKFYEGELDGSFLRLAVIVSRFTEDLTERLLEGALEKAKKAGVSDTSISVFYCPGAFEIPLIAEELASSYSYDAVICLGCVIRARLLTLIMWLVNVQEVLLTSVDCIECL